MLLIILRRVQSKTSGGWGRGVRVGQRCRETTSSGKILCNLLLTFLQRASSSFLDAGRTFQEDSNVLVHLWTKFSSYLSESC